MSSEALFSSGDRRHQVRERVVQGTACSVLGMGLRCGVDVARFFEQAIEAARLT
jgi:hypothetical protein